MTFIVGTTVLLFAWAIALALLAVSLRLLRRSRRRRRQCVELAWRQPLDAFVLGGVPLPPVPSRDEPVVLDLLLRYRAALRGPEAVRITDYLEDTDQVRRAVQGLRSRDRWRRASSAVLLGRIRSDTAVAALVDAMSDESEDVRMVAAHSLGVIGDPAGVRSLTGALADSSRWTATHVAADLLRMGAAAVPTLIEIASSSGSGRPGAHEAGVTAVRVLGEIRDHRAAPVLIDLLSTGRDLNVRARAAAALGTVGGPLVPEALRAALADEAWQVRAQAATGLGALRDRQAVGALSAAIVDENWWVRRNCAEALARLGQPGRQALVALSAAPDRYVRERCRAVLQQLDLGGALS